MHSRKIKIPKVMMPFERLKPKPSDRPFYHGVLFEPEKKQTQEIRYNMDTKKKPLPILMGPPSLVYYPVGLCGPGMDENDLHVEAA
jgi:hypothetical protein